MAQSGPRPRWICVAVCALALVALAGCGGGGKKATPEPRVVISLPSASASPPATPTPFVQAPPTGGAPAPNGTAPGLPAAPSSVATCTAGSSPCPTASASSTATTAATGSGTPAAGAPLAPSSAAPLVASSDPTLQAALARALLREADLPSGYTANYLGQTDATLANQTAGYGGFFANGDPTNPGPGGFQVFIAALAGFTDPASAAAQAGDVRSSAVSSLGQGVVLTPLPTQAGVAGAQLYRVEAPKNGGGQLTGFVIAWQHGRVLVVLAQLGLPPPTSPDIINAIAKRQDDKLRAAGL